MSDVLRVRAAAGVLRAAMKNGLETPDDLAQVLEDCCLLQSPKAEAARAAAGPPPAISSEQHTIGLDVEGDSPAADLALRLRGSQYDVTHTDVRNATEVQVTVRPQSPDCLRWWLAKFAADPATGVYVGDAYTVQGRHKTVTVYLVVTGDAVTAWSGAVRRAS
ncbi:hypothetical protein [Streptomyces erythrochromogenes]|uniref:hypothetical protein n=1 Tax=Streptomyces erythrochromogenes TaxID=285574 RepID=UPI0036CFCBC5